MKDVDGLHPNNMGRLMAGRPRFVSATPAGIQQMLLRTGNDPSGKNVVVCGRSNIVGKPIANLLMQRLDGSNATVTVCHTRTANLPEVTRGADILIAAMGQPRLIKADMVKDGAVVNRRRHQPRGRPGPSARLSVGRRRRLWPRAPQSLRHNARPRRRRPHDNRHAVGQHAQSRAPVHTPGVDGIGTDQGGSRTAPTTAAARIIVTVT